MKTLKQQLFERSSAFDFFQSVFLLETLLENPQERRPEIRDILRFKTHQSLAFPSSSLKLLLPSWQGSGKPTLFVNFIGLTGVQGALPLHYTSMMLRLAKLAPGEEIRTSPLQEWFDLFNHQMIAFFYQAWEKYRFPVSYYHYARRKEAGGAGQQEENDRFTRCMLSLVGLGTPSLRHRLHVEIDSDDEEPETLASVDDLALLHHASLLARRPRSISGLVSILQQYFGLKFEVKPFSGQWLTLDPQSQARMTEESNCELGVNVIAGERIWDLNSIFRVRIGPLHYHEFIELLPDATPVPARKLFFLVSQLIRLFVGPEFDFELQLLLYGNEVPECMLQEVPEGTLGARLGWNTWLPAETMPFQVEETIFFADERTSVEPALTI